MKKGIILKKCFFLGIALLLTIITLMSATPKATVKAQALPTNDQTSVTNTTEQNKNIICVMGCGEVEYIPNVAQVSVGVETLNIDVIAGQTENSEKINKIVNTLIEFGVSKEDIKTRNFNVYPRYNYSDGQKFMGYQITNTIEFKTKNIESLGTLISKTMENGANSFNGIDFTVENYEEVYEQALTKALNNAKSKAKTLAKGATSLTILNIRETNYYNHTPSYTNFNLTKNMDENMTIFKGKGNVKANIQVEFAFM